MKCIAVGYAFKGLDPTGKAEGPKATLSLLLEDSSMDREDIQKQNRL